MSDEGREGRTVSVLLLLLLLLLYFNADMLMLH
jgi:hypothetical protein